MQLSINYATRYRYSQPVARIVQLLRLTPLSFPGQNVLDWRIDVDRDARLREARDGYGNIIHMLYIDQAVDELKITATGRVMTEDCAGVVRNLPADLPPLVFLRETQLTASSQSLREFASSLDRDGRAVLDKLHALTGQIHARMTFDTTSTEAHTIGADAFDASHGVCQDYTHIFIAVSRLLGIPARYVSGHLFRRDLSQLQEAAHAWAEAWIEDLGWVGFDPTNGISTDDAYVRVACGLDYQDAAPIAGARSGGGSESLFVEVQVSEARQQAQSQSQS
jgi:transglutaminase-like putative cysteine protease